MEDETPPPLRVKPFKGTGRHSRAWILGIGSVLAVCFAIEGSLIAEMWAHKHELQAKSASTATQPAATPTSAPEPEKTLPELIAAADKALADRDYGAANVALDKALELNGRIELSSVPLLQKKITALNGSGDDTLETFQDLLAANEIAYGPLNLEDRQALRGVIAGYDGKGDFDHSALLIKRYENYATELQRDKLSADESLAIDVMKKAIERADKDGSSHDDALLDAQNEVSAQYPDRPFVLAVLQRLTAEQCKDCWTLSSTDGNDTREADLLRTALGNAEQTVDPYDPVLVPFLSKLAAAYDQSGEHDKANVLIDRLNVIRKTAPH